MIRKQKTKAKYPYNRKKKKKKVYTTNPITTYYISLLIYNCHSKNLIKPYL